MKTLIALLLLTAAAAAQQSPTFPRIVPWKQGEEVLGTATISGDNTYLRDLNGIHVMTVIKRNGRRYAIDPEGRAFKMAEPAER